MIWPALAATARSAMVVSSVSPLAVARSPRCSRRAGHLDGLQGLGQGADLVDLDQDGVGHARSMPCFSRSVLVTNRSSPTSWILLPRRLGQLLPAVPVVLGQAVLDGDDRVAVDQSAVEVDHLGGGAGAALAAKLVLAVLVELGGGAVQGEADVLARACSRPCEWPPGSRPGPPRWTAGWGRSRPRRRPRCRALLLEHRLQVVEDLGAHAQASRKLGAPTA